MAGGLSHAVVEYLNPFVGHVCGSQVSSEEKKMQVSRYKEYPRAIVFKGKELILLWKQSPKNLPKDHDFSVPVKLS